MRRVTFSKTVLGGDGETLQEGGTYPLNDASADHWLKRGYAVEEAKAQKAEQPKADKPKAEADPRDDRLKAEAAEVRAHEAHKKSK